MTSLNELKTGKQKLELINQVLARISDVSLALDNTRLDEIIGLKADITSLYEKTLNLKQEVEKSTNESLEVNKDTLEKYKEFLEIFSEVKSSFESFNKDFESFNQEKDEIKASKENIESINKELKNLFADLESIKKNVNDYELLEKGFLQSVEEVKLNANTSKNYAELSIKLKDDILKELEHAQNLKDDLHNSINLIENLANGIKADRAEADAIFASIKNVSTDVKELLNEAESNINKLSEDLKSKVNTITFENQRLNMQMIEALKRCEEILKEVTQKHDDLIEIKELILQAQEILDTLKQAVKETETFRDEMANYTALVKSWKELFANYKTDLQSFNDRLKAELEINHKEFKTYAEALKAETQALKAELVAFNELHQQKYNEIYNNFVERAKIANNDLGALLEIARKEIANDKALIEQELFEFKNNTLTDLENLKTELKNELQNEFKDFKTEFENELNALENALNEFKNNLTNFENELKKDLENEVLEVENKLNELKENFKELEIIAKGNEMQSIKLMAVQNSSSILKLMTLYKGGKNG